MHKTQLKILEISTKFDVEKLGLRELGRQIGVAHPQVVLYHLNQLRKLGLLQKKNRDLIEKLRKNSKRSQESLVSVPILGAANCGIATIFAQETFSGYLKISSKLLPHGDTEGLFILQADGDSMNRARIHNKNIDDGDYLLIDSNRNNPKEGDYVLSIIDGCANVKKIKFDEANGRIALLSESTKNYPPIYVHPDDDYLINGLVVGVIKKS